MHIRNLARVTALAVFIPAAAQAHMSETGQDYSGFKTPAGNSCCSNTDCRPAQRRMENGIDSMVDGNGISIPFDDSKRLKNQFSSDGNWHVCATITPVPSERTVYCIIAPAMSQREPGALDNLYALLSPQALAQRELEQAPICRAPQP